MGGEREGGRKEEKEGGERERMHMYVNDLDSRLKFAFAIHCPM